MGNIVGFIVGIGIVLTAWEGELTFWGLPIFLAAAIIGALIFPFTIGTFMTQVTFFSLIAIVAALINSNSQSALAALSIGVSAFVTQFIIGLFRGDVV